MKTLKEFDFFHFDLTGREVDSAMEKLGFIFLGDGKDRRTYLSRNKRFVIKVPKDRTGRHANYREAEVWKKFFGRADKENGGAFYAPCRLLPNGFLMMRAMVKIYGGTYGDDCARSKAGLGGYDAYDMGDDRLPKWAHDCYVDSCQIGVMANGKMVVYDYG